MNEIRQRILKKTGVVLAVLCVLSLFEVFTPEAVSAGTFDNAYTFYQTYGKEMTFRAGANNQGEIYYATKAKKDNSAGIKYTTLGWKIRILNSAGTLVDTIYYKTGGTSMVCVDTRTIDNYGYKLYKVTLTNIKERMSQAAKEALKNPGCSVVFDACTTTKIDGEVQGGMTDSGPSWGKVYTTYNGIVNAEDWTAATKETLKTYYNKTVKGLFYNVTLSKGTGISKVSGAGKYLFGSMVSIQAKASDGYHFNRWSGDKNSTSETYSFVLYGKDVSITASAVENTYNMVYQGNGGHGNVEPKSVKYTEKLTMPKEGFTLEGSSLSGWATDTKASIAEFLGGQKIVLKELVNQLKLQHTNGATITLYATWDHGPVITTKDIYVSLEDARNGKITEEWLAQRAEAHDQEDGKIPYGKNGNTSFLIIDYQESDFTDFTQSGAVTETFYATDSAGNSVKKTIRVHIEAVPVYPVHDVVGKVRFISKKYFKDEQGSLIDAEDGGLEWDSIWRLDEEYLGVLEQLFNSH